MLSRACRWASNETGNAMLDFGIYIEEQVRGRVYEVYMVEYVYVMNVG